MSSMSAPRSRRVENVKTPSFGISRTTYFIKFNANDTRRGLFIFIFSKLIKLLSLLRKLEVYFIPII